jgi:hypothetical protein
VIDLVIALALALCAIALAPGLAIVAIAALLVLLVCGASVVYELRRGRRAAHQARPGPDEHDSSRRGS